LSIKKFLMKKLFYLNILDQLQKIKKVIKLFLFIN